MLKQLNQLLINFDFFLIVFYYSMREKYSQFFFIFMIKRDNSILNYNLCSKFLSPKMQSVGNFFFGKRKITKIKNDNFCCYNFYFLVGLFFCENTNYEIIFKIFFVYIFEVNFFFNIFPISIIFPFSSPFPLSSPISLSFPFP